MLSKLLSSFEGKDYLKFKIILILNFLTFFLEFISIISIPLFVGLIFDSSASIEKFEIEPNSETEFITEHYWGYAKVNDQKSNEYEVTHPKWKVYKVNNFEIKVDFGTVYGKEFEFLNEIIPNSVMLAEGSEITVENKTTIKTTPQHCI